MTNEPNPQQLLRRPKKPVERENNFGAVAAIGAAVVVIGGAATAYLVFGHAKSAANPAAAGGASLTTASFTQPVQPLGLAPAKHKPAKKPTTKPAPDASPSAAPTATPLPTPSPIATAGLTPAQIAHARRAAALRLAALRRAQAQSPTTVASTTQTSDIPPAPQLTAPPTEAPAQAAATPTAVPAPAFEPRVVVDARFIDRVSPVYPDIAREQGASGTAIVLATVGPTGSVLSVDLDQSTGNKLLDSSALSAARASRFEAPEIDGRPATETYRIVYTFDPNQEWCSGRSSARKDVAVDLPRGRM